MKKRIEPLFGIHHYGNRNDQDEKSRTVASVLTAEQKAKMPVITHKLARPHPVTGRKSLYAVSGSSFGIVGMPEDEARDLLDELAAHSTQPKYQLRFKYGVGDIVVWDNASLLHCGDAHRPGRRAHAVAHHGARAVARTPPRPTCSRRPTRPAPCSPVAPFAVACRRQAYSRALPPHNFVRSAGASLTTAKSPANRISVPMRRAILFAVLSLLLLSMQHQGLRAPDRAPRGPRTHARRRPYFWRRRQSPTCARVRTARRRHATPSMANPSPRSSPRSARRHCATGVPLPRRRRPGLVPEPRPACPPLGRPDVAALAAANP